jgi:hypothetical protein
MTKGSGQTPSIEFYSGAPHPAENTAMSLIGINLA